MTATLLIHFGSPRNRSEVGPFVRDILADHFHLFFAKPISFFAKRAALKKYEAVGFKNPPFPPLKKGGGGGFSVFTASQYGQPSIEEALTHIDESGTCDVTILPLYPHASLEMYDSIFKKIDRLRNLYFRGMHFKWAWPFFDHPLFIEAWAEAVRDALAGFGNESQVHLIFCAHAHPHPFTLRPFDYAQGRQAQGERASVRAEPVEARMEYEHQVEVSAKLIWQSLGSKNSMSIAYQSAMRLGQWSRPSLKEEMRRLALSGVSNCLIVPVSFLFDNVETLFDIDRVAIPAAIKAGMREVKRAKPPGDSGKIVDMLKSLRTLRLTPVHPELVEG